jgi:hypothetical protein
MANKHALTLLVISTLFAQGCQEKEPIELLIGIDTSGSTAPMLQDFARQSRRIAALVPKSPTSKLAIYRYDTQVQELYDNNAPKSVEKLQEMLEHNLQPNQAKGTSLANIVLQFAKRLKVAKQPTTVVLLTDGGNDDTSANSHQRTVEAAQLIAQSPCFKKMVICGAQRGSREELRTLLAPLGSKLSFSEPNDLTKECK